MSEMLRENPQKLAKRASLYLILIIAMLAPYQAAQAWIISFGPGGTIYIHLQISGGSYDPVTDVYVYSKSTAIDTKSTPRFESRNDDVGTWHNGFVQYGLDLSLGLTVARYRREACASSPKARG